MPVRDLFRLYATPLPVSLAPDWIRHVKESDWLGPAIFNGLLVRILAWILAVIAAFNQEAVIMIGCIALGVIALAPARVERGRFVRDRHTDA